MDIRNTSLRAQLNFIILCILFLTFVGSVWINVANTRVFLSEQLEAHAQDTATSLGMSLGTYIIEDDEYSIHASINAIFDRGYFQAIKLENIDGTERYIRELNAEPQNVPTWFTSLFPLDAPTASTQIDTGWTIGGQLYIQAHPGLAYLQLWDSAKDSAHTTFMIFILALLLGYLLLRQVYKPINQVVEQANAITSRNFVTIDNIPRTKELASFVAAMNQMVRSIRSTFTELTASAEKAQRDAYEDGKTGLPNRKAFTNRLDDVLSESQQSRGYLLMVRMTVLAEVNNARGYEAGDALLNQIIKIINQELQFVSEPEVYRISGSELGVVLPNQQQDIVDKLAATLIKDFALVDELNYAGNKVKGVGVGAIAYQSGDSLKNIMSQLDLATRNALYNDNGYFINLTERNSDVSGGSDYKNKITQIIDNASSSIKLRSQKVKSLSTRAAFEYEIFAGFELDGLLLNTGDVFAAAENYNLAGQLDVAVLHVLLTNIDRVDLSENGRVAIQLSRKTLFDIQAIQSVINAITVSGQAGRLVIALTENAIIGDLSKSSLVIDELRKLGCKVCVNRFGSSMQSLKYLLSTRPDVIKLDGSYTRNINEKNDSALMLESIVNMAHGIDIPVVAQYIETSEELDTLALLNIDAALGYVIDRPICFYS